MPLLSRKGSAIATGDRYITCAKVASRGPRIFDGKTIWYVDDAVKSDLRSRAVKKRVIHRDVGIVCRALVDQSVTTVAAFSVDPVSCRRLLKLRAVVLRAADGHEPIQRMNRDAFKLHRVERRAVQIRPDCSNGRIRRSFPNAAVVAGEDG